MRQGNSWRFSMWGTQFGDGVMFESEEHLLHKETQPWHYRSRLSTLLWKWGSRLQMGPRWVYLVFNQKFKSASKPLTFLNNFFLAEFTFSTVLGSLPGVISASCLEVFRERIKTAMSALMAAMQEMPCTARARWLNSNRFVDHPEKVTITYQSNTIQILYNYVFSWHYHPVSSLYSIVLV